MLQNDRGRRVLLLAIVLISMFFSATAAFAWFKIPRSIDVSRIGPAETIYVYDRGQPSLTRQVAAGSTADLAVKQWLADHRSGWTPTLDTYAPKRYIRGKDFTLNFTGRLCVLNYAKTPGADTWMQVCRNLHANETPPNVFAITPTEELKLSK